MVLEQRKPVPQWLGGVRPGSVLSIQRVNSTFVTDHSSRTPVTVSTVTGPQGFNAIVFRTEIHEDVDGAPTTYAAPVSATDHSPKGGVRTLDHINNATNAKPPVFHPLNPTDKAPNTWLWTGVMSMTADDARRAGRTIDDRDFLQDGRNPGHFPVFQNGSDTFYVGQTAINLKSGEPVDPTIYPYGALSFAVKQLGVRLGDFGLAIRANGALSTPFVYADAGGPTSDSVGEYSTKLIENLFNSRRPNSENICFIAFPGSRAVDHPAQPELMDGVVRSMISNLNLYDNAEDLPLYLANPDAWEPKGVNGAMIEKKGMQSIYRSGAMQIRMALTSWGFNKKPVVQNKMIF